jgi:hypothetical protein
LAILIGALAGLCEFLLLILRKPFRAFLDQQVALLANLGIRIDFGDEITVPLDQRRGNGAEMDVSLKPVKNYIVG